MGWIHTGRALGWILALGFAGGGAALIAACGSSDDSTGARAHDGGAGKGGGGLGGTSTGGKGSGGTNTGGSGGTNTGGNGGTVAGGSGGTAGCIDPSQLPPPPSASLSVSGTCASPAACGGTPSGTWALGSLCLDGAALFDAIHGVCNTASIGTPSGGTASGTLSFSSGTMTLELHAKTSAFVEFPNNCSFCQCTQLETTLASAGFIANCNPVCNGGTCSCSVTGRVDVSYGGAYTTSGSTLTTTSGLTLDYCVGANGITTSDKSSGGTLGEASFVKPTPQPEICDGVDNDLNGVVDDNPVDCPPSCTNLGVCATSTATCIGPGGWQCSNPPTYQSVEALCDGLDNDCNGTVDDEPAASNDCVAKNSVGYACQAGSCACATLCGGTCVDAESDPNNCGGCGNVCTGLCAYGHCQVILASGQGGPGGIAVDAANVYWTNYTGGTVMKVATGGGTPTPLASGQSYPDALAIDATNVYWTGLGANGVVMKVPMSGGTPTTLASNQSIPSDIAVDATSVYWTNQGDGTIMKVPVGGGTPTTLASGQNGPVSIAVDANSVYWLVQSASVMKVPLAGGTPVSVASGSSGGQTLAIDATGAYWTASNGVESAPLAGGAATTLCSSSGFPYGIGVDAANVYFTNYNDGTIMKVALAGGAPIVLASGQKNPDALVVDQTSIYWTNANGGSVVKLTPK